MYIGDIISAILLGGGLAMDAFAVSMCKGLAVRKLKFSHMIIVGLYFGLFQAAMPTIGFFLGSLFKDLAFVKQIDHWIAFILLAAIGINMIRESFSKDVEELNDSFKFRAMLPLAVATSIDALAAGISFIEDGVNAPLAITATGIITFLTSAVGVKIGNIFGARYKSTAERVGGIVLCGLGLKFVIEGFVIPTFFA